ncbi:hypothetical protein BGZ93_001948 [Podila epicladia]|nr:hypothetical protein BGZ92_002065 [Podila epicladia]KAG0097797.1 hypothetical protein BGZ93_001948 [Podila epicladia]
MASQSTSVDEIEDIEGNSSDDGHHRPPVASPRPNNLQSYGPPGRRFIFPNKGYQQQNISSKQLYPLSKHTKPKAPPSSFIQSSRLNRGQNQAQCRQATTPTKNGSVLSRSFQLGFARKGGIKRHRSPSPRSWDLVPAGSQQPTTQTYPESMINMIPLPIMILEQFPKVTLINQHNSIPAKPGCIHIFALVLNIGPLEKTKSGYNISKISMTVCDTSIVSFKVTLWGKDTRWANLIKFGDVVLMTNLKLSEFQGRINGNTTTDTTVAWLDGSALTQYHGHAKIEAILKELIKTRQAKALHLFDTGIAQEPSLYMTQDASMGWEIGAALANGQMIKMKSTGDASWIRDMVLGRVYKFFGKDSPMVNAEPFCGFYSLVGTFNHK